jgi:hypothetical protein
MLQAANLRLCLLKIGDKTFRPRQWLVLVCLAG